MAEQHTPGPWEIAEPKHPDPRQIEDRLIFATVEGEKLHVAEVYQYQNDKNREANGTAIANAELIASAPEQQAKIDRLEAENALLREVSRRLVTLYDALDADGSITLGEGLTIVDGRNTILIIINEEVRAVLAKAEPK